LHALAEARQPVQAARRERLARLAATGGAHGCEAAAHAFIGKINERKRDGEQRQRERQKDREGNPVHECSPLKS
jgi:hypothetical protein